MLPYTFTWTDVKYETGQFDFKDIDVKLHGDEFGNSSMMFDFPAIEKWTVHAN